jgi:hypothetical protein
MNVTPVIIAAALAATIATPTLAAVRYHGLTPDYVTCEALAVERGAAPGQGNSGNPDAQHHAFVRQCLEGKIPL